MWVPDSAIVATAKQGVSSTPSGLTTARRNRTMAAIMSPTITPEIEARFWAKVDKTPGQGPKGDCWCWIGGLMSKVGGKPGYPKGFGISGRSLRPSHVAMAIDRRPRPNAELEGMHSCDHPPCVRPDHLRWGTHDENMREHVERRPYGRKCLSPELVREIRASADRNFEIAARLGVTQPCISNIRRGVSHKHII